MIGQPLLTVVMVTIALSLIIRSMMQIVYGPQERTLPTTPAQRVVRASWACGSRRST